MNVEGKRIIVTGGAGGLGSGLVRNLLDAGAYVAVFDLENSATESLREEYASQVKYSDQLLVLACDLLRETDVDDCIDEVIREFERVDVLVNNAAIYPSKAFESYSRQEFRETMAVNVESAFFLSQKVLGSMRDSSWGRIINVSSVTFCGTVSLLSPYVTSKAALIGMTRALARELGEHGITVNTISPGAFPTAAEEIHENPEEYSRFVLDNQSIKRRGNPGDIANLVRFLSSDESGFITGQNIHCDGGWFMN